MKIIDLKDLRPSQTRISQTNIALKLNTISESIKEGVLIMSGGSFPVLYGEKEDAYFLKDGHHSVAAAYAKGARRVCVRVEEEVPSAEVQRNKDKKRFPLKGEGLTFYLWDLDESGKFYWNEGEVSFEDLLNKPEDFNRSFLMQTKVLDEALPQEAIPLWVKENVPPFAEWIMGDALRALGFVAGPEDHRSKARVQEARQLLEAIQRGERAPMHPFTWQGFSLDWVRLHNPSVLG